MNTKLVKKCDAMVEKVYADFNHVSSAAFSRIARSAAKSEGHGDLQDGDPLVVELISTMRNHHKPRPWACPTCGSNCAGECAAAERGVLPDYW